MCINYRCLYAYMLNTRSGEEDGFRPLQIHLKYLRQVLSHCSQIFNIWKCISGTSFKPKITELCWQFLSYSPWKSKFPIAVECGPLTRHNSWRRHNLWPVFDLTFDLDFLKSKIALETSHRIFLSHISPLIWIGQLVHQIDSGGIGSPFNTGKF